MVGLAVLALSFNGLLAIVNAHGMALTITHVAAVEAAILAGVAVAVLSRGMREADAPALALSMAFVVGALLMSFINGGLVVEALRNVAIVVLFTMLGIRSNAATIRAAFAVAIALVLGVMLIEIVSVPLYSGIFNPFSYYLNTRGLGEVDYGDTGLFGNALGFEGRFSFGLFTTPRTSSIFVEQTSLANFASVIAIYLATMWRRLNWPERVLALGFVALALLSNNTRLGSTFAALTLIGYAVYPRLPRAGLLVLPLALIGASVLLTQQLGPSKEDDLAGRIGLSMRLLSLTDLQAAIGARAFEAGKFPDSGYSYVLFSSSLVGAILLWLYVALIVPYRTPEQRRCAWALALFLFVNLLVAGNAIFSAKVGALLWLLAGFMRVADAGAVAHLPYRAVRRFRSGHDFAGGGTIAAPASTARRFVRDPIPTGGAMQEGCRS